MKYFILLFFSCGVFAQTVTTTKKYNDILNRYEYFNSYGQKIGYETYEPITRTWKYTQLNATPQNDPYYHINDYGNTISVNNSALVERVMAEKQRKYTDG